MAAPPLAYTKSNEHAWSPGTIWLSATTVLAVLDDIGRCIAGTEARRLVFFNGHGGNTALINVANREIRLQHGLMTFLAHPGVPPDHGGTSAPGELGMGIHGGADETSLMLHLADNLVDLTAAERNVPEWLDTNQYVRFGGPVSFGWLSDDFGLAGHIGDPTVATVARGAELFEAAVDAFCGALREIATFTLPAPDPPTLTGTRRPRRNTMTVAVGDRGRGHRLAQARGANREQVGRKAGGDPHRLAPEHGCAHRSTRTDRRRRRRGGRRAPSDRRSRRDRRARAG